MCLRRFCLTLNLFGKLSQLLVSETSGLLKGILDLCSQLLSHIFMKCIFVSLQKQRVKAQQTGGLDSLTWWEERLLSFK